MNANVTAETMNVDVCGTHGRDAIKPRSYVPKSMLALSDNPRSNIVNY